MPVAGLPDDRLMTPSSIEISPCFSKSLSVMTDQPCSELLRFSLRLPANFETRSSEQKWLIRKRVYFGRFFAESVEDRDTAVRNPCSMPSFRFSFIEIVYGDRLISVVSISARNSPVKTSPS